MNLSIARTRHLLAVLAIFISFPAHSEPKEQYGRIEWIRDTWGIPHVFSETDAGAMYGLGFATAAEHGFQMTYGLRIIQGRLAEVIGERRRGNRNETTVDNDRKMRAFGWALAAHRTASNLDRETLGLLQAYCEGVNDSFAEQKAKGNPHPLFVRYGMDPELWTPADCLLSWWHLAQFFATDGTRDLNGWRNLVNPQPNRPRPPRSSSRWIDDSVAVVQQNAVSDEWLERIKEYSGDQGFDVSVPGEEGPKFSHAWVVGGKITTTGSAVLVSDPQTPVRNPSLWMEFHVAGKLIDARGVGVPGSPGLLIGFNRNVAWGLTALGADQADLFRLETDPARPDQYRWDGEWRKMRVRTERIKVSGGSDVELTVRETHLGPIASEFCFRRPNDPEVALKRVPLCEDDRDTIHAVFGMMRAKDSTELARAAAGWRFPSANCVFGDRNGNIGYSVLGAIPVRSSQAPDPNGSAAASGTEKAHDWRGFVPPDLLPRVTDPQSGFLLSANHRPVGAFYKIPLGISTGSMGDTIRSWRLRELLRAKQEFSPKDVLAVHYDCVNPARREMVRLGLHLRNKYSDEMSPDAIRALSVLEKWFEAGASSSLDADGAALATRISTFFRMMATPVALEYGGGESGLARFLKDARAKIEADSNAQFSDDARRFIDTVLADAWRDFEAEQESGETRMPGRRPGSGARKLGWFDSLDGFGSLDSSKDLNVPRIKCLDGQTIHSQAAQSYTQWVPLDDVDSAQTICPIGHSDRPDSRYRTSTLELWGAGKLHPAPLSRPAVERIAAERRVLAE